MSMPDCASCAELRENAADFVTNGVTSTVCASLKNNTGLNPNLVVLHDNEEDLHNVNDCYIGQMDAEIEAYDVCDWKDYMHKLVPNIYETLKAMICDAAGQWTAIQNLQCQIGYAFSGANFFMGEVTDPNKSYVVPGDGVSFKTRSTDPSGTSSDLWIQYVAGGLVTMGGSLEFFSTNWTEPDGTQRTGNAVWATVGDTADGDELVYEVRIKKSQYPQIKSFHSGYGQETNVGGFHVMINVFNAGEFAYGQHGGADLRDGTPWQPGFSSGHLVPDGWIYIQMRMSWIDELITSGNTSRKVTPIAHFGIRMNKEEIDC